MCIRDRVHTVPWMIVMAVVIFGVTMVLAELQTKRIVDPINRLDPKNPQDVYKRQL